mmetsp:Transcript_55079/g.147222  ORF Transcript_55079/g.147222 Transcript_55079/m.147222 type:complete len:86 (+) Transcript_55079:18-275(+)
MQVADCRLLCLALGQFTWSQSRFHFQKMLGFGPLEIKHFVVFVVCPTLCTIRFLAFTFFLTLRKCSGALVCSSYLVFGRQGLPSW